MKYNYLSRNEKLNFDNAVEELRNMIDNRIVIGGINNVTPECIDEVLKSLKSLKIDVKEIQVDKNEYEKYLSDAEYSQRYPDYYVGNFTEKSLEHFLCYKFLNLESKHIFVDIAGDNCPLPEIYTRLSGCTSYSQDIMYNEGINGKLIGGDAANMPITDNFFDSAVATCSIEHFENDSDKLLIKELSRVMKKNGRFIFVPLYLYSEPACQTDPICSVAGDVKFDDDVTVFCAENWGNRHGRFYSPATLYERLIKDNPNIKFTVYYISNTETIPGLIYCRYMLIGEKIR